MPISMEIRTKNGNLKRVKLTPSKSIKHFCLECCGWDRQAAKDCKDPHCALYPFSLNKRNIKSSKFDMAELDLRRKRAMRTLQKGKAGTSSEPRVS